ncbi:MAG: hypothetical protein FWD71_02200 [Oscillospiraceae bacterium]|nr:hypothetical protein [Oscillospiraceae bacterium]
MADSSKNKTKIDKERKKRFWRISKNTNFDSDHIKSEIQLAFGEVTTETYLLMETAINISKICEKYNITLKWIVDCEINAFFILFFQLAYLHRLSVSYEISDFDNIEQILLSQSLSSLKKPIFVEKVYQKEMIIRDRLKIYAEMLQNESIDVGIFFAYEDMSVYKNSDPVRMTLLLGDIISKTLLYGVYVPNNFVHQEERNEIYLKSEQIYFCKLFLDLFMTYLNEIYKKSFWNDSRFAQEQEVEKFTVPT